MTTLRIPQPIIDAMIAHARELDPYECCGLLAGKDGAVSQHYRITNTVAKDARAVQVFDDADVKQLGGLSAAQRAEVAYFMEPKEMLAAFKDMRARGLDLTVIYHSHTHSPAYPSMTDIGLAYYPDAAYLIVSLEQKAAPYVRTFWIRNKQVTPATVETV